MDAVVGGHVKLDDTRIYYEIFGEGAPLLLLHGNGEDLHAFDPVIPQLQERYRVIALDTRGHGKSAKGTRPFQFDTFARDAAQVMEILKIPRAHILGYSDGGSTAMHLALTFPERLDRLVLLGANMTPGGIEKRYQYPIVAGYLVCKAIARIDRRAAHNRDMLELMVKHPNLSPGQLQQIQAPTLVLAGERDMVKRSHTEQLAGAIPRSQMEILEGEDHFSLVKSQRMVRSVLRFLDSRQD